MEKFLKFLSGYVILEVQGEQCERFLNLCRAKNISIRKLKCPNPGCLILEMHIRDFFSLRPVRSKTGVHIRVIRKYGMPFFIVRSKKRIAFFAGILLCAFLILFLSGRIWNIHIEGNIQNPTPDILGFLSEQGIVHGISKRTINCADLAASVRRQYPEITWVSARIEGTRLLLTIQEEEIPQDSVTETETPCSLAADVEGTIVKIITKAGTPQVLPGDICKKGELLVLGRLEILNDSQEIIRYEYVHADADIYVEHELPYYREFSLSHEEEFLSGDTEHHSYIRLGNFYLDTGKTQKSGWRRTAWEKQVRLTENFYLPIWLGNVTFEKIQKVTSVYSKEEAKSLAVKQLQQYEEKLIEQGMEISANHVKIETDYDSCTARGTLTVIEKTGIPVAVERKEDEET